MSGIWQWIEHHAKHKKDHPAIIFNGAALSYQALSQQANKTAGWLQNNSGVKRHGRVAYLGFNSPEQIVLTFACARNAMVIVPLNWRLAAPEQRQILNDCQAEILFASEEYAGRAKDIAGDIEVVIFTPGKGLPCGDESASAIGEMSDPLAIVYTSGTTGEPKGAVLNQSAFQCNALNSVHMHDMDDSDHILTVLPMFHVGGLNIQTMPAFYCGAVVTLHERFEPAACLNAIAQDKPTLTVQVPATFQALMGQENWQHSDLSSLKAVATGSTDVPVDIISVWHDRKIPVIQVYGSTETGPVCLYQRIEEAYSTIGSIGRQGKHSAIRLVGDDGKDVAIDQEGEIWVRGENVAGGYWDNKDLSAQSFEDGWFRSGDVARLDKNGLYWFCDRIKNVIISGGENIYPAELERVLRNITGVREAAVTGMPDARWGTVPVAAVVAESEVTVDDIKAGFEGQLARYKHPRQIVMVAELPRNVMGKVDIAALKKLLTQFRDA